MHVSEYQRSVKKGAIRKSKDCTSLRRESFRASVGFHEGAAASQLLVPSDGPPSPSLHDDMSISDVTFNHESPLHNSSAAAVRQETEKFRFHYLVI